MDKHGIWSKFSLYLFLPPFLSPVSEDLTEGAQLISDLQAYQWQRLAEPPSLGPDGITSLPPPSQLETETGKLVNTSPHYY